MGHDASAKYSRTSATAHSRASGLFGGSCLPVEGASSLNERGVRGARDGVPDNRTGAHRHASLGHAGTMTWRPIGGASDFLQLTKLSRNGAPRLEEDIRLSDPSSLAR
jgi:hypothetical protein